MTLLSMEFKAFGSKCIDGSFSEQFSVAFRSHVQLPLCRLSTALYNVSCVEKMTKGTMQVF